MLTGRQLIGLRVRDSGSGKNLGRISDIFADAASGQVRGFAVAGEAWLSRTMFLPAFAVESIGLGGVMAEAAALKRLPNRAQTATSWRGAVLRSSRGRDLGVVSDVVLDEGRIAALEISGGLWADAADRRSLVAWDSLRPEADGSFIRHNGK